MRIRFRIPNTDAKMRWRRVDLWLVGYREAGEGEEAPGQGGEIAVLRAPTTHRRSKGCRVFVISILKGLSHEMDLA
jgi:hypothetical protein